MGMGMAPELDPDVMRGLEKFQMTNFTMPNNTSFMKYALYQFPELHKDVWGGSGKSFK